MLCSLWTVKFQYILINPENLIPSWFYQNQGKPKNPEVELFLDNKNQSFKEVAHVQVYFALIWNTACIELIHTRSRKACFK